MPRNYKHKKRGKTLLYKSDQMAQALQATENGMSVRKAAELYNVPKSTLADRVSGRYSLEVVHGRPTAIPLEIESKLVQCVKVAAERGIGLSRKQLLLRTNVLCKRIQVHTSYKNFHAGKNWWEGLKRRHGLTLRQPERLGTTRCRMMNREVVSRYFDSLSDTMSKLNLLDKPDLIWNCDETGKNFEHDPVKIVAGKGVKNVCGRTSNKSSSITIMACVNAAGIAMPPMFVAKGKTSRSLYSFNTQAAPANTKWSYQDKGWMTDQLGEQWFDTVFLEHCGPQRPQLLILDGHSSHESLAILQRAIEENIFILALPPHTTHHLQPLDKSVFGPFNKAYNSVCSEFLQDPLNSVNKWNFPALITRAWLSSFTEGNIKSGFAACGIFPLNQNAIHDQAFAPSIPSDRPLDIPNTSSVGPHQEQVNICLSADDALGVVADPGNHKQVEPSNNVSPVDTTSQNDNIVDVITDPSVILDLLSSGEFVVDAEINHESIPGLVGEFGIPSVSADSGVSIRVSDSSINQDSPCLPDTAQSLVPSANWNQDIDPIFLPPSNNTPAIKQKRKTVTSHRLLTSDEIIQEKIAMEMKKMQKQNKPKKQVKRLLPVKKEH